MHNYLKNIFILIRIHQPIGFLLLFYPCVWGIFAAVNSSLELYQNSYLIILFLFGSIVMRGAGCVINDIFDRNLDNKVSRTKDRPIASHRINLHDASLLFIFLSLIGLCILLSLSSTSIKLGLFSFGLLIIYPLCKRFTYWPQLFLGITFNIGVLIAYTSVLGKLDLPIIYLYAAGIFWTLGYDTIYAHQDKKDDLMVGIKSTAILFGQNTKKWVIFFYSAMVLMLLLYGTFTDQEYLYFIGLFAILAHFTKQITSLDIDSPSDCLAIFKSNQYVGLLISIILLTKLI